MSCITQPPCRSSSFPPPLSDISRLIETNEMLKKTLIEKALCIYALQLGRLLSISKFLANGPGTLLSILDSLSQDSSRRFQEV